MAIYGIPWVPDIATPQYIAKNNAIVSANICTKQFVSSAVFINSIEMMKLDKNNH